MWSIHSLTSSCLSSTPMVSCRVPGGRGGNGAIEGAHLSSMGGRRPKQCPLCTDLGNTLLHTRSLLSLSNDVGWICTSKTIIFSVKENIHRLVKNNTLLIFFRNSQPFVLGAFCNRNRFKCSFVLSMTHRVGQSWAFSFQTAHSVFPSSTASLRRLVSGGTRGRGLWEGLFCNLVVHISMPDRKGDIWLISRMEMLPNTRSWVMD